MQQLLAFASSRHTIWNHLQCIQVRAQGGICLGFMQQLQGYLDYKINKRTAFMQVVVRGKTRFHHLDRYLWYNIDEYLGTPTALECQMMRRANQNLSDFLQAQENA